MAISNPTVENHVGATDTANSITSGTVSPSANALLVVVYLGSMWAYPRFTNEYISDTFGDTLTWTQRAKLVQAGSSETREAAGAIWTTQVDSTPGSGTITVGFDNTMNRRELIVIEIASGFDTSTPVTQAATEPSDFSGSMTVTLSSSPDSDACLMGASCCRNASGMAGDSAYTVLADTPTGDNFDIQVEYDNGGGDTTWDVTGLCTNTVDCPGVGLLIEIAPEAAAAGAPPPRLRPLRFWRK